MLYKLLLNIKGGSSQPTPEPVEPVGITVDYVKPSGAQITLSGSAEGYEWVIAEDVLFNDVLLSGSNSVINYGNGVTRIEAFYFRAKRPSDVNWNNYGKVTVELVEDISVLNLTATPGAQQVLLIWNLPVAGATNATVEISTNQIDYTTLSTSATTSYTATSLTNDTEYFFRVTPNAVSIDYQSNESIASATPAGTPTLTAPSNLVFTDLGGGDLEIEVIYSGESGVTYIIERDEIQASSSTDAEVTVSGFVDNTQYVIRAKVQKAGFNDSAWVSRNYTYNPDISELTFESFGGEAFYEVFMGPTTSGYSKGYLTVTPLGNGTSRITCIGGHFNSNYINKQFVSDRINFNADETGYNSYIAGSTTCRYSTVISVEDSNNLIVDFEYNGGDRSNPKPSINARGYFFFDNEPIRAAIIDFHNGSIGDTIVKMQAGKTYVLKGFQNKTIDLTKGAFIFESDSETTWYNFKLSFEDAFTNVTRTLISSWGNFPMLKINEGNNNIGFIRGHLLPPFWSQTSIATLTITVDIFSYSLSLECERELLYDSNNDFEKDIFEAEGISTPEFTWNGMNLIYAAGGGVTDENDVIGYQTLKCRNAVVRSWQPIAIKTNNGGGNFIDWDGGAIIENQKIKTASISNVTMRFNRRIRTNITKRDYPNAVNLPNGDVDYGFREAEILSEQNFFQALNQYWDGGTSSGITAPLAIRTTINGQLLTLCMGNVGDWRFFEQRINSIAYGNTIDWQKNIMVTAKKALFFDQIPIVGDVIPSQRNGAQVRQLINWGWSLQIGDKFTIGGEEFIITNRLLNLNYSRIFFNEPAIDGYQPAGRHFNMYTVDKDLPIGDNWDIEVTQSVTEQLLTGTHVCEIFYNRDLNGHATYNNSTVGFSYRNMFFSGFWRSSGGFEGTLKSLPKVKELINVTMTDGSQLFNFPDLKTRYNLEGGTTERQLVVDNSKVNIVGNGERILLKNATLMGQSTLTLNIDVVVEGKLDINDMLIPRSDGTARQWTLSATINLVGGYNLSIDSCKIDQTGLNITGVGTVVLNNVTSTTNPANSSIYGRIVLGNNMSEIDFTSNNGDAAFKLDGSSINVFLNSVLMTNWTFRVGTFINNAAPSIDWPKDNPPFCNQVSINGACPL